MLRRFMRRIIRLLFRLLSRVEATGLEHIPSRGKFILCANHLGTVDPALIFILFERDDVTGLVAKKHQKNIFFRWLVNIVGGIWLNREKADTQALRAAFDHLNQGGVLGVSPEGTRSKTGALIHAKTGVAYIAHKTGAPILPVALTGTEKLFAEWARLRRPRFTVTAGELFTLAPLEPGQRDQGLKRNTDEIMCRIAVMLPEGYRGVYAEHPRLAELLAAEASGGEAERERSGRQQRALNEIVAE